MSWLISTRSTPGFLLFGLLLFPALSQNPALQPPNEPQRADEGYETRKIDGWNVNIRSSLIHDQPELANQALTLLEHQLFQVGRAVPSAALEKIRTITIWVEEKEPHTRCMTYHPDPGWLREHGVNPAKAHCVELANVHTFLEWTHEQPWMLLHELAHAYHHQFLPDGFENPSIRAVYQRAMERRLYNSVLRINGKEEKAYAAENAKEYFAESTEALFGTNDFYPYVRSELQRHDPEAFRLLRNLWGVPPVPRRTSEPKTD
jgi:hypothetical protein